MSQPTILTEYDAQLSRIRGMIFECNKDEAEIEKLLEDLKEQKVRLYRTHVALEKEKETARYRLAQNSFVELSRREQ